MKINEYLSLGVPVVMTNFADLVEFNNIVSVANFKEEFVEKIVSELSNDTEKKIMSRIAFAKNNDWNSKSEEFGEIIGKRLKNEFIGINKEK